MRWSPKQLEARRLVAQGRFVPALVREDDGWHARWRPLGDENDWVDEFVRAAAMTRLSEDAEEENYETIHDAWMMALRSRTGLVRRPEAECAAFAAELKTWAERAQGATLKFTFAAERDGFAVRLPRPRGLAELRALGEATYVCGLLRALRREGEELVARIGATEAEDFLHTGALNLVHAGYAVEGADLSAPVVATAEIAGAKARPRSGGESAEVHLVVKVAGEPVTAEEIRFLLDQGSSLVFFRSRWIEVNRNILKEALRALDKVRPPKVAAISFALGLGHIGNLELEEVKAHGWVRGLVAELRRNSDTRRILPKFRRPPGLVGELRDYQRFGVEWIDFLTAHGFGALLADDMGLGKTIETIAALLRLKERRRGKLCALVAAPLTLLANWRHELRQFAPKLKVYVHQGEQRTFAGEFLRTAAQAEVTLVSYGLLVREYPLFSEVAWDALVIDEAQTVKNPLTQVSRAVRALSPGFRLALTGTPIENTVADVWSLEEFLNPGFLGDEKSFRRRFVKPIATDPASTAAKRLRHALEPLVLRRVKGDPAIAAEIGEKREVREYCTLSAAQRWQYEEALTDFRATAHAEGDVFALLTRLKLICDGEGKLQRLLELLQRIFAAGESALIFTQYAKVGEWLRQELEKGFARRFPYLHGALTANQREREIAAFNRGGAQAFILSLKAGGFGLNLTKATHVIHFDRWWNPAVENQATDRAHRIGQTKNVLVHLFITEGTLEERIDQMLLRKESLKSLLSDGERFYRLAQLAVEEGA